MLSTIKIYKYLGAARSNKRGQHEVVDVCDDKSFSLCVVTSLCVCRKSSSKFGEASWMANGLDSSASLFLSLFLSMFFRFSSLTIKSRRFWDVVATSSPIPPGSNASPIGVALEIKSQIKLNSNLTLSRIFSNVKLISITLNFFNMTD